MAASLPECVSRLSELIIGKWDAPYEEVLAPHLIPALRGISLCPDYRDRMALGVSGLPSTSAELVSMGVFYIDGDFVALHPVLANAFEIQNAKKDGLLERLKRYHENTEKGLPDDGDFSGFF